MTGNTTTVQANPKRGRYDDLIGATKRKLRSEWLAANPTPVDPDGKPIPLTRVQAEERWDKVLAHLNSFEYTITDDGACVPQPKGKGK